jgi:polar amino acid transport system substrate-binding protein
MIRAALALIALCVPAMAMAETWRIGTEADYAPYIFHDSNGKLTGMDRELGGIICNRAGVKCVWIETTFDTLFTELGAGRFDIVMAGIGETPDRLDLADFSTPYFETGANWGAFAALTPGVSPDSARIGVQGGTTYANWLAATGRQFQSYPSNEAALDALLRREVEAVFLSSSYYQFAFESDWPQLRLIASEEFPTAGTSVAVRKGATEILARINAILAELQADGTIDALQDKWFVEGEPV